jgi:hypothetical protein
MSKFKPVIIAIFLGFLLTFSSYFVLRNDEGAKLICNYGNLDIRSEKQEVRGFPKSYYSETVSDKCSHGFGLRTASGIEVNDFAFNVIFWSLLSALGLLVSKIVRSRKK